MSARGPGLIRPGRALGTHRQALPARSACRTQEVAGSSVHGVRADCGPAPVGTDLALALGSSQAPIESIETGGEPSPPRLRSGTVADWWLTRFEAKVAAGEWRGRTLESHRYHLEQ